MDIFGKVRIAKLTAENDRLKKELSSSLLRTHFREVAKDFKIEEFPAAVMGKIIDDMKPYIVPELHRMLERVGYEYSNRAPFSYSAVAYEEARAVTVFEVSLPAVTVPVQVMY